MELKQKFSGFFSLEQCQAENLLLSVQHQKRIEAAFQFLPKQQQEGNQLLQELNQSNNVLQDEFTIMLIF